MGKEGRRCLEFSRVIGICGSHFCMGAGERLSKAGELKTDGQSENTTAVRIAAPKVGGVFQV
jgi:hypothetical protein